MEKNILGDNSKPDPGNKQDESNLMLNLKLLGGEEILERLVLDSPIAVYTCDAEGYLRFYNKAAVALWGREPELGKDLWCGSWKIYYPDGEPMPLDMCPMARTLKEGKSFEGYEITIERPNHQLRNLMVFPRPIFNEDNVLIGAHNTLVDITEQKQGGEKQAILSAIVESSDDAIISKTTEGIITSWNSGAEKIFGYTEKEALGKHISILIPERLLPEETLIIGNIRQGKRIDHFQTTRVDKAGNEIAISLTVSPVRDSYGRITGASKIARDISQHLKAEQLLQQSAKRLQILNNIGKIISEKLDTQTILQHVTDATTVITGAAFGAFFYNTVNPKGEAYMLYTLSGAPREAFENFGIPRNTEVFGHTFSGRGIVRSEDIRKDPRYGHNAPYNGMPEGHLPVVSYLAVPVISGSGNVIGGLFFGHPQAGMFTSEHEALVSNIASQASVALDNSKLFEEVKELSAKKDEFIALASHELKTPLTTIKGFLQLLERLEHGPSGQQFITKTLQQVERLNGLVADLLDISRIEAGKLRFDLEVFDLGELVEEVTENFNYTNKSHRIVFANATVPLMVNADKQRIEQAVINLLTNAIKYSPNSDKVHLSLEKYNDQAIFRVTDTGIGLTKEQQQNLFTRFYRAEGAAGIAGLGIGLYLTKEIIDRHQGRIGVTSQHGIGSEFFFSLPLKSNGASDVIE